MKESQNIEWKDPYNPLLADAFFRAGYVESWGRGIEKIDNECKEHDIEPPLYDSSLSGLMVTFKANPLHLVAAQNLGKTAQKNSVKTREKILRLILDDPELSTEEMASTLGLSRKGVEWQIRKLKETGLLQRIGPDKGGRWKILK